MVLITGTEKLSGSHNSKVYKINTHVGEPITAPNFTVGEYGAATLFPMHFDVNGPSRGLWHQFQVLRGARDPHPTSVENMPLDEFLRSADEHTVRATIKAYCSITKVVGVHGGDPRVFGPSTALISSTTFENAGKIQNLSPVLEKIAAGIQIHVDQNLYISFDPSSQATIATYDFQGPKKGIRRREALVGLIYSQRLYCGNDQFDDSHICTKLQCALESKK